MGIPIRAKNKNKVLLVGHIYYTIVHMGILYLLYHLIGFLGPAIAFVFMETIFLFYFGSIILRIYNIKIKDLFYWRKIFTILLVGLICTPVLYLGDIFKFNEIFTAVLFSSIYIVVYLIIINNFHFEETDLLLGRVLRKLKLVKE